MKMLLFSCSIVIFSFSQSSNADFIYLESGAKSAASSNVFFVDAGDMAAYRYFPADYTLNTKRIAYTSYVSKFDGLVDQFSSGYSQPLFGGLNISANYNYSGVSDIPKYSSLVIDDGTREPVQQSPSSYFSNSNHIVSIAFGKVFDNIIDVGWDYFTIPIRMPSSLQVNYQRSNLDVYSANAFTIDASIGLIFNLGDLFLQTKGIGDLALYTSYMNIAGTNLIWDKVTSLDNSETLSNSEEIPSNIVFGFNYITGIEDLEVDFGFGYQYQSRYKESDLGFLFEYQKMIELRFGFGEVFSIGAGAKYQGYGIFLTLRPHEELGKNVFIDLNYEF